MNKRHTQMGPAIDCRIGEQPAATWEGKWTEEITMPMGRRLAGGKVPLADSYRCSLWHYENFVIIAPHGPTSTSGPLHMKHSMLFRVSRPFRMSIA